VTFKILDAPNEIIGTDAAQILAGTAAADVIYGLGGNDIISSGDGDDVLVGGRGNDQLIGGAGNDTYVFGAGDGQDKITDTSGDDTLRFDNIDFDQLWFSRAGNNLEVSVIGSSDKVTVSNWYVNTGNRIEHFQAGGTLTDDHVQALVEVMQDFTPPPAGTTELDSSYAEVLEVIAAHWLPV
jgi:Ca2+-binding RTX toxin-like protein